MKEGTGGMASVGVQKGISSRGWLDGHSTDLAELYRQGAQFVDRILKGAKRRPALSLRVLRG